jgi:Thoeris protein ThsA, Macro domain
VAVLGNLQRLVFALAYDRMGNDTVVRAEVKDLWHCFYQLWTAVNEKVQRGPVSIPLMGSGLARVTAVDRDNLLRLILLSFAAFSRTQVACHECGSCLPPMTPPRSTCSACGNSCGPCERARSALALVAHSTAISGTTARQ